MIETNFLLTFFPNKREGKNVKTLIVKVKLDKPILGANFFEIRRTYFYSLTRTKVFRTNLVNESNFYITNLDISKKLTSNQRLIKIKSISTNFVNLGYIQPSDYFLISNDHVFSHDKIKIADETINEFEIETKNLNNETIVDLDLDQSFIHIVIYHVN